MQIHLKTLGCRLNEAELETWALNFQKAGHSITRQPQEANLLVINSCAVTQEAVRKSKQMLRRIHRNNPSAKLVVSGCYATLDPDFATQTMGVDMVVANKDKSRLVEMTLAQLNLADMPEMATESGTNALFSRGRQRAFVKVQDGCRYQCTFCIVTKARGEEVSRQRQDIIEELNKLHQQGVNEVILTGVHLGGYGSDINTNLMQLIEQLLSKTNIPRIRLGSLEPWDLPDGFFQLFSNTRLMPHLHLPLQSGSNSVLKRMARRCKTEQFAQIAEQAREAIPHFNLTTDIIVGFPGETKSEWHQSIDFISQLGFGHIHIFSYSPRPGTRAATLPNQVAKDIKKRRSQELHRLAESMKQKLFTENSGHCFPVLWESNNKVLDNGKQQVFGYTPNYLRVMTEIDQDHRIENQIIDCRLTATNKAWISAELVQ